MTDAYFAFVKIAKDTALARGLTWELPCDAAGKIHKDARWNLSTLVGQRQPYHYVSDFGFDPDELRRLNAVGGQIGSPEIAPGQMSQEWRDLYLAVAVDGVLIRKVKPSSAMVIARSIKRLAAVAGSVPPWMISADHVRQSYNACLLVGASGKIANDCRATIVAVLDEYHLAEVPSLSQYCIPYETEVLQNAHDVAKEHRYQSNRSSNTQKLRKRLSDRKTAAKLPQESAFWELVRICFTEAPQGFTDVVRFAVLRMLIITGLRVNEIIKLPLDCIRWRDYTDADGTPAGLKGGISRALQLRYFAEKKEEEDHADGGLCLYESLQTIPPMFEEIVIETVNQIVSLTMPLRDRLDRQHASGRLLPEWQPDDLIPAYDMYTMLTGNAYLSSMSEFDNELDAQYRASFNAELFDPIRASQLRGSPSFASVEKFWSIPIRARSVPLRDASGNVRRPLDWRTTFVRVGDVEEYVRAYTPTKMPDLGSAVLADGTVVVLRDFLFIIPHRNITEARSKGLLDTTRYVSTGPMSSRDIHIILDGQKSVSIFKRYSETGGSILFKILPHELRHLQNTELFRLGVSDAIITKRFGRDSIVQSHVYDHRSLSEHLAEIDVPGETLETLTDNARDVYKMVLSDKVRGPIIDDFRRIQAEHGDGVAFEYLNAEADGLHATPYGFCVNSFTIDPCPKHLECFNGCRHLARTDIDNERVNLETLLKRTSAVVDRLEALPEKKRSLGWRNQLEHAKVRRSNICKALAAQPGSKPFPDGPDLSESAESTLGDSILDRKFDADE
jgi:hypothetical protein